MDDSGNTHFEEQTLKNKLRPAILLQSGSTYNYDEWNLELWLNQNCNTKENLRK